MIITGITLISAFIFNKIIIVIFLAIIGVLAACTAQQPKENNEIPKEVIEKARAYDESKKAQVREAQENATIDTEMQDIDELLKNNNQFFVVRNGNFFYTDEAYESQGPGNFDAIFASEKDARQYALKKQKALVKNYSLDDLFFYSDKEIREALISYFKKNFDTDILDKEYAQYQSIDRDIRFPENASETQIDEILKLGDINMVYVYEFNGQPKFYTPDPNKSFWNALEVNNTNYMFMDEYNGKHVYQDKQEAIEKAYENSTNWLYRKTFKGTLDELSDSPALLKAYIDSIEKLSYNEELQQIEYEYIETKEMIGLLELLKEKPFAIRELDVKEFKKISQEYPQY